MEAQMTRKEAAEYLGVKAGTLAKWACIGKGPAFYRTGENGGRVWYEKPDLDEYLKSCRVQGGAGNANRY